MRRNKISVLKTNLGFYPPIVEFYPIKIQFPSEREIYVQCVHSNLVTVFFTNTQFPLFSMVERKEFNLKVINDYPSQTERTNAEQNTFLILPYLLSFLSLSCAGSDLPAQKLQNLKSVLESHFCQSVKDVSIISKISQLGYTTLLQRSSNVIWTLIYGFQVDVIMVLCASFKKTNIATKFVTWPVLSKTFKF